MTDRTMNNRIIHSAKKLYIMTSNILNKGNIIQHLIMRLLYSVTNIRALSLFLKVYYLFQA